MSDAAMYREQLRSVVERLKKLDAEREGLLSLRAGYEALLRLVEPNGDGKKPPKSQLPLPITSDRSSRPKGSVSLRGAVLKIIQEAKGEPVHASTIWERARAMGAITTAKEPHNVVDLVAYSAKKRNHLPLERVGPLTWRWAGD